MKGIALLLLCAVALVNADQPQRSRSGTICLCTSDEAATACARYDSDNELIVHENCNQFYKCSNGQAVPYFCPTNLLYNPVAEICDWPLNVECGSRPIVDESEVDCSQEVEDNDEGSNGQPDNGGTDSGAVPDNGNNVGTCNCNPGEAPGLCATDGSDGVLVAHENCNQFYKCDHGVPVALNCPSGLLYNPYTEQCDWAENVECGDRPVVDTDGGGNSGGDEDCSEENNNSNGDNGSGSGNGDNGSGNGNGDNETGGGTCNCNPGEAPGICSADGSDGVLVAHENCNQFYKCDHGIPVALNCPSGLLYNPYTEQCDWADKVECGDRPIVDIDGGNGDSGSDNGNGDNGDNNTGNGDNNGNGNGDNNGNGNGDNGSTGTCNCNPGEAPGICAADGSDGTLVAHENCNQFYKCAHGSPVTVNCPAGLLYNPYIECCDWPYNVDCGDKPIVEIDGGNNGDNGSGDNNGNGDSGSGNGNGDNGSGNGDNGSGNGNGDNESTGTCNCNPGEAPGICAVDGSDGTLVAHENCNEFYKCANGAPVTLSCPAGLVYNPYIECCDWPYNVECGDRPIVEVDGGNNGNGDNGSGNGNGDNGNDNGNGDSGSGNGNGDNGGGNGDNGTGDGTCNCNPGEAPGICAADGSGGILIAHENCNQFYKCDHGLPVVFNCNNGLMYNPYTEQCDWPHNVECGDKPIVEIDSGNNGNGDNGSGNGNGDGDNGSGNGNGDNGSGNGNGDNGTDGGTCNCNPGEAPGICAADGSGGILIAHENCNQFYKCDHGLPVVFNCNNGLMYNPYTEQCDWPHNVECGDKPIVEIDSGNNGNGDNGSGNGNGDGDNGSGNGNGDNGSGNGNGDNGTDGGTCNCNPGEAPGICAADGSGGILIAHENCNQFYKCDHGLPVVFNCNNGLMYNPYTEKCDWPHNVECGDKPIVEIDSGNNGNGDNGSSNGNGDGDNGSGNGNGDNGSGNGNGDNETDGGTCNCNPGEAPGICAADGSGGILIAHENCNQFYKCDHGLPVVFNCNNGLMYNPYTEQCDWPHNVECGDKPIVEIDSGNNGNGDNGSGNGNGDGDNGSGNGNGDNGSGNGDGDNGSGNGSGDNGTDGGTCNCNPDEAPGICAADGSGGVLIAHENCNQFYKCDHGLPVAFNCYSGLMYNPYTEQCDWPHNVECGNKPIAEIDNGGTDNGGNDGSGDNNAGAGNNKDENNSDNCDPSEAPALCAASGSDGVLVAHENCNQFYKCSEGLPVALICPSTLLYNPATKQCDWPENVDCADRVIPDNNGSDNGGNGETGENGNGDNGSGNGNGDNENTCNCNPGEAPAICANGDSEGVLIAHEKCNKFYKCSFGNPVAISCPDNLLYNPFIEVCDWAENVDCGDRVIPEAGGDNNGGGDNGGDSNGGDNGGENGGDNNNTGGNCDPSQAPSICEADGSNGVLVAHENCNQFYVCSYGSPVALDCPTNLLYNPSIEQCDWPRNVDCGERVVPVPEPESDGGTCLCNSRQAPGICASSDSNGKMIAHEACNQYYVCFNGKPIARSCPLTLFYDPHTKQCNWPAVVSCDGRDVTTHFSLNKHMQARRGTF